MEETKILGQRGEAAAKKYLLANNYKIIAANYKSGHQEIDIITYKNKEYIFIEVKTRLKNAGSQQEDPLSSRQVKNIKIAILDYAYKNKLDLESIRLDLIFILVDKKKGSAELKHYQNIF